MIPLRFTELAKLEGKLLFTTEAGDSFVGDRDFLHRFAAKALNEADRSFLRERGLIWEGGTLSYVNYLFKLAQRLRSRTKPDYFMLVPTLRCDLSCSYCQVSRADIGAKGFDWTDDVFERSVSFILDRSPDKLKLEFQGGEPTLRLDLVERMIGRLRSAGKSVEVVICTNLSNLTPELKRLLEHEFVFVSTSIDGSIARQARQRTKSISIAKTVFRNVDWIIERYGAAKLSALPTIDREAPPTYDELYDVFASRGINSIFLRPINYQGFARKNFSASGDCDSAWSAYYRGFIDYLIERGAANNYAVSEFYFVQCLRRIFSAAENGHVDLRNPSILGLDFFLIDFDGRLFPTDEARMLDRIGEIDLSIGDVWRGINIEKIWNLNQTAFNNEDPDCIHCAFQPYCGGDVVDSISRYARADIGRHQTVFCRSQIDVFDKVFSMLSNPTDNERMALSVWLGLPAVPTRFLDATYDPTCN